MFRIFKLLLILTVPILLGGCAIPKPQANTTGDSFPKDRIESLAKALTSVGAEMYSSRFCSACQKQKEMFGEVWQYVTYVECSTSETDPAQNAACQAANIEIYPTWTFKDGSRLEELQSFEALARKINFTY